MGMVNDEAAIDPPGTGLVHMLYQKWQSHKCSDMTYMHLCLQKLYKKFPIYLFSVIPPCGATVTQNLTYLIQDVTTNPGLISCPYTICPISKAVNRIRLDLNVSIYSNRSNRTEHPNL